MYPILIICGFCICECFYPPNLLVTMTSMLILFSWPSMEWMGKNWGHQTHTFQLRSNKVMLCPGISALIPIDKFPFHSLLGAMYFAFLCFLYWLCYLKWPPSITLECCLVFLSESNLWLALHVLEKIHVLEKFCSRMSYSAVCWYEFNVNEPTIHNK